MGSLIPMRRYHKMKRYSYFFFLWEGGGEIDMGTIRHEAEMDSLQDGAQLSGLTIMDREGKL